MIANEPINRKKAKFLTIQIRDAERQVLNRQAKIAVCTTTLINQLEHQITAPSSLWLAGSFGFLLGELTRSRPGKQLTGAAKKSTKLSTSPVITALRLLTSIQTLYTALPIAWILRTFHRSRSSTQVSKRLLKPVSQENPMPVGDRK